MRRTLAAVTIVILAAVALAPAFRAREAAAQPPSGRATQTRPDTMPPGAQGEKPPGAPGAQGAPGGPGGPGAPPPYVFNQARADSQVMQMLEHIKGKEDMPAESVYKNIQIFKGMPAKRIPSIMVMGFSRSLGMRCTGCHNRDDFSSDEKGRKKVARAMWTMTQDLNKKYLPEMKDLETDNPVVNCWTCHRGNHEPEINAPAPGPPAPQSNH